MENLFISILELLIGQIIQEQLKRKPKEKEHKEGRWI